MQMCFKVAWLIRVVLRLGLVDWHIQVLAMVRIARYRVLKRKRIGIVNKINKCNRCKDRCNMDLNLHRSMTMLRRKCIKASKFINNKCNTNHRQPNQITTSKAKAIQMFLKCRAREAVGSDKQLRRMQEATSRHYFNFCLRVTTDPLTYFKIK